MEGFKRAGAGALLTVAVLAAAPAAHAAGVGVTQISSLPAGAKAGNLTGVVTNESDRAARAEVSVRVMRRKTGGALIGKDVRRRRRARHEDLPGGRQGARA